MKNKEAGSHSKIEIQNFCVQMLTLIDISNGINHELTEGILFFSTRIYLFIEHTDRQTSQVVESSYSMLRPFFVATACAIFSKH